MNSSKHNEPIKTIPKGVWEASRPDDNCNQDSKKDSNTCTLSTDLQGNGYPSPSGAKDSFHK